jgi:hypothetical protein
MGTTTRKALRRRSNGAPVNHGKKYSERETRGTPVRMDVEAQDQVDGRAKTAECFCLSLLRIRRSTQAKPKG